jgi:hypothetical protein
MKLVLSVVTILASFSVHAVTIASRIDCSTEHGQLSYKALLPVSPADFVDDGVHVDIELTQAGHVTRLERLDLGRDGQTGGWEFQLNNITFSFPAGYAFVDTFKVDARLGIGHMELDCKTILSQQ